ncbi:MAG: S-ribosylhomocysteine lyase [Clostridia bacterium]|nr:S-ribosylhomocysteine lyase [Clostridia bacterium]
MKKIHSFEIDHFDHDKGFYLSTVQGDAYTYDLRFKTPNGGDYVSPKASHTIEHLLATTYRNSDQKDNVLYFGPMGCRTGFYLVLRNVDKKDALSLTVECIKKAIELDTIPGNSPKECGNYLEHDLKSAKEELIAYLEILSKII